MRRGRSDVYLSAGSRESGEGKDKVSKSSKSEKKPKSMEFKEFTSEQLKKLMRRLVDLPPTTIPVEMAKYAYDDMLPIEFLVDRDIISKETCNSILYRSQNDIAKVEAYLSHSKGVEVEIDLDRQAAIRSGELDPVAEWEEYDGKLPIHSEQGKGKDSEEVKDDAVVEDKTYTDDGVVSEAETDSVTEDYKELVSKYELSLENLKQKVKVLEGDLKSKEKEILQAQQEKKALEERLESAGDAGTEELEAKIAELESKLSESSGVDTSDLESEIADLEALVKTNEENLKAKGGLVKDLEEALSEKDSEIEKLKSELKSKEDEIQELKAELDDFKSGASDALKDLDSEGALGELESLLSEKFKLEHEELELSHKKELEKLEKEHTKVVTELESSIKELEEALSLSESGSDELEQLVELKDKIESEYKDLDDEHTELKDKYNKLDKDYLSLERDKIEIEKIKLELELEQGKLEDKLEDLEESYAVEKAELLKGHVEELDELKAEHTTVVDDLETKVSELEDLVDKYKGEKDEVEEAYEALKEELKSEKVRLEESYKSERSELESEITKLETSLKEAEEHVDKVKSDVDTKISDIISQYDKRLEDLDTQYVDRVRDLEDKIKELENELFKYKVTGGSVVEEYVESDKKVGVVEESSSSEVAKLKKENIDHLTRIGDLQKEIKNLKSELRSANKDLSSLKDIEELEEYKDLYEGLLEDMKESDLSYESKISTLESKLSEVEEERDKLQKAATNFLSSSDEADLEYTAYIGETPLIHFNVVELPPHFNTFYRSLRMIADEDHAVCDIVVKSRSFFDDVVYSDYVRLSDIKGTKYSGGKILVDRLSKAEKNKLESILEGYDLVIVKDFIMSEVPIVENDEPLDICVCNDADKLKSLGIEFSHVISPRDASIVDLSYASRMTRINNDVAKSVYYSEPCRVLLSEVIG